MITFFFRVGKSFLKYSNHPITIPRENNSSLVKDIYGGSGKKTIKANVIPPKGRILDGEIYYGIANWGEYYQIKVLGQYPSDYFGHLKIGELLGITIKKADNNITVRILSPQGLKAIAERL